jgi:hypothetical protein
MPARSCLLFSWLGDFRWERPILQSCDSRRLICRYAGNLKVAHAPPELKLEVRSLLVLRTVFGYIRGWLNRDPPDEWADINLYRFKYDSALSFVDPDGESPEGIVGGGIMPQNTVIPTLGTTYVGSVAD